jgi:ABC-type branched-subunit amino acid transport system permease subunit
MEVTSYTVYWPFILGTILILLLFFFPGGIVGFIENQIKRWRSSK